MNYSMLLVPADPRLRPPPHRVLAFLDGLATLGSLPAGPRLRLGDYATGQVLRGTSPETGEPFQFRRARWSDAASLEDLRPRLDGLQAYAVSVWGVRPPGPMPIRGVGLEKHGTWRTLDEAIAAGLCEPDTEVEVRVDLREGPVSLSDSDLCGFVFGEPCEDEEEEAEARLGRFRNLQTGDAIEVPGAGLASFWISVQLGKWLTPRFTADRIDFAEPGFRALAERTFGTPFLEGCEFA